MVSTNTEVDLVADDTNRYIYYNGGGWRDMSMENVPINTIFVFCQEICPTGWIFTDGTSGVIDYANGTDMSVTYGKYMNDSIEQINGVYEGLRLTRTSTSGVKTNVFSVSISGLISTESASGVSASLRLNFDSVNSATQGGARTN